MSSLLQALLAERRLGLRLVAGADQVDSRGPCRWVHIFDVFDKVDPAAWLEGGELVLTSGLTISGSPDMQREFVRRLAACGCYALGYSGDFAPPAMIEEANRVGLPLFTVPYRQPLIAVTQFVAHYLIAQQYSSLRRALGLHRRLLGAITANCGLIELLHIIGEQMPGFGFRVLDYFGRTRAEWDAPGVLKDVSLTEIWAEAPQAVSGTDPVCLTRGELHVICTQLRIEQQVEAILVAVSRQAPDEVERLLFDQAAAGVVTTLARELSSREARRALVDELLSGLATGKVSQQMLAERASLLALPLDRPIVFVCVPTAPGTDISRVCAVVEDAIHTSRPAVGRWDGLVFAIVEESEQVAEDVLKAVRDRGWLVPVGRSRPHTGISGMVRAFREAEIAARRGRLKQGVNRIEDVGVASLLASIESGELAEVVVKRVLGPLIDHDRASGGNLVDSLDAYLRNGCRPGPAARELFVHRHTLTYRLDRIAQLTGQDPRDGDNLLEFAVALELFRHGVRPSDTGSVPSQANGPVSRPVPRQSAWPRVGRDGLSQLAVPDDPHLARLAKG